MENLIKKYNVNLPRYTSYPAYPSWNQALNESDWLSSIKNFYNHEEGLDLYIHIPFCEKLCYYCGCNRVITKNHNKGHEYVASLVGEWELLKKKLNFTPRIRSIHFGGGTPTFLKPESLDLLLCSILNEQKTLMDNSIEIDPRTCEKEHLPILMKYNFKRISMGIQDFDEKVQKTINRIQPYDLVKNLLNDLETIGVNSINFDLIYGLPFQTEKSIEDTIEKVIALNADMIAFYSYAHLPEKFAHQKLIKDESLPKGIDKRNLFEKGKEILLSKGFIEIGLDHFAKKSNYLARAKNEGKLARNFMGHTDKKSELLIGLGVSSISETPLGFSQNIKEIGSYYQLLGEKVLPISSSHRHTIADKNTKSIIENLMCNEIILFADVNCLDSLSEIKLELETMEEEGLLKLASDRYEVTALGKVFLRNIAKVFDYRLRGQKETTKFSTSL